jgi:hypothetical protein
MNSFVLNKYKCPISTQKIFNLLNHKENANQNYPENQVWWVMPILEG